MTGIKKANVTWVVDGNNYVCWEQDVRMPNCDQLKGFVRRVEDWLDDERRVHGRVIEVYVVFDPGAKECYLPKSDFATIVIAPPGKRADKEILQIARRMRRTHPESIVRVVSNDQGDEFATLRREEFEQWNNLRFQKRTEPKGDSGLNNTGVQQAHAVRDTVVQAAENRHREYVDLLGKKSTPLPVRLDSAIQRLP